MFRFESVLNSDSQVCILFPCLAFYTSLTPRPNVLSPLIIYTERRNVRVWISLVLPLGYVVLLRTMTSIP